ncbi:hypothetical protein [Pedosphaera parvula]|uniref:Lipoprotein n=1 Tax=Pedosphaera parvula (strain Ellin514) TaxID=320771 RepID=B9X9R5_PEDPL|nr:hypothetical protein [Pedosphaera parvula]EEF63223.1 hypothetical protein Cflav_PD5858 [Pedosphaera parvula Ellin514]
MKNILVLIALASLIIGCGPKQTPPAEIPKGPSGTANVRLSKGAAWFASRDIVTTVLVFTDSPLADANDPEEHVTSHGTKVPVVANTRDGRSGTISIAGTEYDVANGNVFLVSTVDGKFKVQQLARDLMQVQPNAENIEKFAMADQEIGAFLNAAEPAKK